MLPSALARQERIQIHGPRVHPSVRGWASCAAIVPVRFRLTCFGYHSHPKGPLPPCASSDCFADCELLARVHQSDLFHCRQYQWKEPPWFRGLIVQNQRFGDFDGFRQWALLRKGGRRRTRGDAQHGDQRDCCLNATGSHWCVSCAVQSNRSKAYHGKYGDFQSSATRVGSWSWSTCPYPGGVRREGRVQRLDGDGGGGAARRPGAGAGCAGFCLRFTPRDAKHGAMILSHAHRESQTGPSRSMAAAAPIARAPSIAPLRTWARTMFSTGLPSCVSPVAMVSITYPMCCTTASPNVATHVTAVARMWGVRPWVWSLVRHLLYRSLRSLRSASSSMSAFLAALRVAGGSGLVVTIRARFVAPGERRGCPRSAAGWSAAGSAFL